MALDPSINTHLASLFRAAERTLRGFILAIVTNHTDTDDILQNVFVAVMESDPGERPTDPVDFQRWALRIAKNRVFEHFRKSNRWKTMDLDFIEQLADASIRVETRKRTPARYSALLSCLDNLPAESRNLILMRYQGYPVEEIAKRAEKTNAATYGLLKRIRMSLRKCVVGSLAEAGA
jgi:RNA polymerase sigma-70 factor